MMQAWWGYSELPEEKVSRYTVRPGTQGLTLLGRTYKGLSDGGVENLHVVGTLDLRVHD